MNIIERDFSKSLYILEKYLIASYPLIEWLICTNKHKDNLFELTIYGKYKDTQFEHTEKVYMSTYDFQNILEMNSLYFFSKDNNRFIKVYKKKCKNIYLSIKKQIKKQKLNQFNKVQNERL